MYFWNEELYHPHTPSVHSPTPSPQADRGKAMCESICVCPSLFSLQQTNGVNINSLLQSLSGNESSLSIISQVTLPFIIAGFGMVGAGMVLDIVQVRDSTVCSYP